MGTVTKMPPPGMRRPGRDPLALMTPGEGAERMGIGYYSALALYKAHGMKLGGRYYMTEAQLVAVLGEKGVKW